MRKYRFLLLSFIFSLILPSIGTAQDIEERVIERALSNGLKVIMMERHKTPTVAPYILFKAGSVDESEDSMGVAHMLEHMLFKGTKTVGTLNYEEEKKVLDEIDRIGEELDGEKAKGESADREKILRLEKELELKEEEHKRWIIRGEYEAIYSRHGGTEFNASTSRDYTLYTIELPSNKLELWAMLESDRLKNHVLREFYTEREAVLEERKTRVDTDPVGKLHEEFLTEAFQVNPYGKPIIGYERDINLLSRKKAEDFFKIYYAPNNTVMVIVGDINPQAVVQMLEGYFGDIPRQADPKPISIKEPPQRSIRRVTVEFDAEPRVIVGYHKPTAPHYDDYVFDMIGALLSLGRTSRFYKNLIETGIALSAWSSNGYPGKRYDNLFVISGAPRSPYTTGDFEEAVYKELERLKTQPIEEREFNKILKQVDAGFIEALESNGGMAGMLAYYEAIYGNWRYILGWREKMHAITREDIMRVAKEYFREENSVVATLIKKVEGDKQ